MGSLGPTSERLRSAERRLASAAEAEWPPPPMVSSLRRHFADPAWQAASLQQLPNLAAVTVFAGGQPAPEALAALRACDDDALETGLTRAAPTLRRAVLHWSEGPVCRDTLRAVLEGAAPEALNSQLLRELAARLCSHLEVAGEASAAALSLLGSLRAAGVPSPEAAARLALLAWLQRPRSGEVHMPDALQQLCATLQASPASRDTRALALAAAPLLDLAAAGEQAAGCLAAELAGWLPAGATPPTALRRACEWLPPPAAAYALCALLPPLALFPSPDVMARARALLAAPRSPSDDALLRLALAREAAAGSVGAGELVKMCWACDALSDAPSGSEDGWLLQAAAIVTGAANAGTCAKAPAAAVRAAREAACGGDATDPGPPHAAAAAALAAGRTPAAALLLALAGTAGTPQRATWLRRLLWAALAAPRPLSAVLVMAASAVQEQWPADASSGLEAHVFAAAVAAAPQHAAALLPEAVDLEAALDACPSCADAARAAQADCPEGTRPSCAALLLWGEMPADNAEGCHLLAWLTLRQEATLRRDAALMRPLPQSRLALLDRLATKADAAGHHTDAAAAACAAAATALRRQLAAVRADVAWMAAAAVVPAAKRQRRESGAGDEDGSGEVYRLQTAPLVELLPMSDDTGALAAALASQLAWTIPPAARAAGLHLAARALGMARETGSGLAAALTAALSRSRGECAEAAAAHALCAELMC